MDALDRTIEKCKKSKSFKKEWDASQFEYELARMLIKSRLDSKMTQNELSASSGVRQSNISRIENGECLPSLATLISLARGMNKRVKVTLA